MRNNHPMQFRRLPWMAEACFPCAGISELDIVLPELPRPLRLLLLFLETPFDATSAETVTLYVIISTGKSPLTNPIKTTIAETTKKKHKRQNKRENACLQFPEC